MTRERFIKAMVDRVVYDTAESDALANNFYEDGENKFTDGEALELYIDKEDGKNCHVLWCG